MKQKITREGQPCRKCGVSVIRQEHKELKFKPGQWYYFEWWFRCPKCGTFYMVEAAKRRVSEQTATLQGSLL